MYGKEMLVLRFLVASAIPFLFALSRYAVERVADCSAENVKNTCSMRRHWKIIRGFPLGAAFLNARSFFIFVGQKDGCEKLNLRDI